MAISKILSARPAATTEEADTVLELAYLMTAVDGRLADEELPAYREVVSWMRGDAIADADFGVLLERFSAKLDKGDIEARVREVAPKVPAHLREIAFKLAIGLALVDQEAAPEEDELVGLLFEGLGLTMERADALAAEVRAAFE